MKIIFVGIHDKEGLPPLCSTTKSGQIIDKIIERLPTDCTKFEKKNLFPVEYLPYDIQERERMIDVFEIEEEAYYITLGKVVSEAFAGLNVHFFPVHHPGYICRFARSTQERYIDTIVEQVKIIVYGAPA